MEKNINQEEIKKIGRQYLRQISYKKMRKEYEPFIRYLEEATGEITDDNKLVTIDRIENVLPVLLSILWKHIGDIPTKYIAHSLAFHGINEVITIDKEVLYTPEEVMNNTRERFNDLAEVIKMALPLAEEILSNHLNKQKESEKNKPVEKTGTEKKIEAFEAKLLKPFYDKTEAGLLLNKTNRGTIINWGKAGEINFTMSGNREKIDKDEMIRLYKVKILKIK